MSAPDGFEDDLLHAMTRTGEGFGPNGPAGLAAGGLARGRRRWRRRSAAAAVGGAAALALVGTGAVYLTDGSPAASRPAPAASGTPDGGSAGSASPSAATSATPSASPSPSASASAARAVIGADEVLAAFRALLPPGEVTEAQASGTDAGTRPDNPGVPGASLVLDDGKGKAAVTISFSRLGTDGPAPAENDCPDKKYVSFDACTSTVLPDGGRITVLQGYEYPDRRVATKWWSAKLTGKDGRRIELSEWNAPAEKGKPVSRPTPPLTADQLRAVVTDTAWDRVVTALPEPQVPSSPPRPAAKEYTREEILAITAGLLPAGLEQTETGGQPGFADFVVNDGKGKSLVQLNVQDWSKDPSGGGIFGGAETLPDGTRVVVRKQPGKLVMWTVDTLRPNGLRVVVSAFNGGSQAAAGTRSAPALTIEQLRAIALAPDWKPKK
ncbi:hypothetical protein WN990_37150 [Kitasatospora purpeofusca]|uniref:hypothetical protein n=1 Tax=Kitasatospora purpeofusca TaxID=67352 RepID=UPI0030F14390